MHFSVVGNSPEALWLLHAVHRSPSHALATSFVDGELRTAVAQAGLPLTLSTDAESVLVDSSTEVVVVAASDSRESVYLARQASQSGCHVVVIPPIDASTAFSYELNLLLDESRAGLIVLSGRWYLQSADDDGAEQHDDAIRQLTLSLPMPGTDASERKRAQMHAVDAVCGCGYAYSQVTALDVRAADDTLLSRTITLGASEVSEGRLPPASLIFTGAAWKSPTVEIVASLESGRQRSIPFLQLWLSSTDTGAVHPEQEAVVLNTLPNKLAATLTSPEACQSHLEQFTNSLELLAGIDKSLRKRRTIDVHFEGASERGVFKSQMTALGCGVLTYVLLGMMVYLMVAQIADLPLWLLQAARITWVAPVVIFLVLQFLLPVTRERTSGR